MVPHRALITAALLALAPAAASAQATPGEERLATELVDTLLRSGNLSDLLRRELPTLSQDLVGQRWFKPAWRPLIEEAAIEEFEADKPKIGAVVGRLLAQEMTEDELRAGVEFFRTQAGRAVISAALSGAAPPSLKPADFVTLGRILQSPAGQSFARKLNALGSENEALQNALTAEVFPGMMRRFGQKVEAAEAGG